MKKGRYVRKSRGYLAEYKKRRHLKLWIVLVIILIAFATIVLRQLNMKFSFGTEINGFNCSLITVQEASKKLENELLTENQNRINSILETKIIFDLSDGTEEVLDKNIMMNWILSDEDGLFYLDETCIEIYVDDLAKIIDTKNSNAFFNATEIGKVLISVKESLRPQLDKESEILVIEECLNRGGTYELTPIYDKDFVTSSESYVELDITRQKVWLYVDGECIMNSDCVTGNVSANHSTPTGIFYLTYKTKGATLCGDDYALYVEYWMPFNGGIGFHDAYWRSNFGGTIYQTNGSHGCVNMPKEKAKILYEYISGDMPIFVYAS